MDLNCVNTIGIGDGVESVVERHIASMESVESTVYPVEGKHYAFTKWGSTTVHDAKAVQFAFMAFNEHVADAVEAAPFASTIVFVTDAKIVSEMGFAFIREISVSAPNAIRRVI